MLIEITLILGESKHYGEGVVKQFEQYLKNMTKFFFIAYKMPQNRAKLFVNQKVFQYEYNFFT